MLKILEEEEKSEDDRDRVLHSVEDPLERKRLEKILGVERAKTQYLMQKISDRHDIELKNLIKDH